jgi:hypothetical protein
MGHYLQRLGITLEELEAIIASNASLRGVLVGYLAEVRLMEKWFKDHPFRRYDDHDRTHKGDRWLTYKGREFSIEVKSLQSNYVKQVEGGWTGRFQVDASDCRTVSLPNGDKIATTCLVVGEFDLVAINLFEFGAKWRFAFAKNRDLPRSPSKKYTPEQRQYLLQATPKITWPLEPPFRAEPFSLLDEMLLEPH